MRIMLSVDLFLFPLLQALVSIAQQDILSVAV